MHFDGPVKIVHLRSEHSDSNALLRGDHGGIMIAHAYDWRRLPAHA